MSGVLIWAVDALVVLGLVVMTLGVVGVYRMPDAYTKLHAQSKAVALGVICLLVAAMLRGESLTALRGLLVAAFLLATAPVAAHVVARAAWRAGEPMKGERVIDESGPVPEPDAPER